MWVSLLSASFICAVTAFARAEPPKPVDFAHDVAPIIKSRCGECHTDGKSKGKLSLDTRESLLKSKAAVPGKSSESELLKRVTSSDPEYRMPKTGEPLTAAQVATLKAWVDQGLAWEPGFTFTKNAYVAPMKLQRPDVPLGRDHPIDSLVHDYFVRRQVEPPQPLDDVAFLRRVYLDLIGLLPVPEETDAFLKDTSPEKRAKLAHRLLDERAAYTDHWLSFWNDLLRNDYQGTGYIDGGRKQITGWLYRSLLDNKPYDQFVRELISPTAESEGFINGIQWRGRVNASQVREIQFSQSVSQVFFGANLKCASCHDSFIDSWKLTDSYGLAAIIADKPLEINRCDKPTGKFAEAKFLWPELGAIDPKLPRAQRLARLAQLVTHPDNGRFARTIVNRIWQRLMGRGIVHPVDVMANKPWSPDLLDHLATYLVDSHYDLKKLIEHIVTSKAYQSHTAALKSDRSDDEYVFHGPEVKRLTAEQFVDAVWQVTRTAPAKAVAPVPPVERTGPPERRFVRAALVNADALMRSLGRPNREQVVTTRPDQLTTLQALDLANGQILADTLNRGATNLMKEHPMATAEQLVEMVYLRALCRKPDADELKTAVKMLRTTYEDAQGEVFRPSVSSAGLADLLWAVVMLPEFQLAR